MDICHIPSTVCKISNIYRSLTYLQQVLFRLHIKTHMYNLFLSELNVKVFKQDNGFIISR